MGALISYILALRHGGQSKGWSSSDVIVLSLDSFCSLSHSASRSISKTSEQWLSYDCSDNVRSQSAVCTPSFSAAPISWSSTICPSTSRASTTPVPHVKRVQPSSYFICRCGQDRFRYLYDRTGLAVPVQVSGAVIAVFGAGLLYTLDFETITGKWIRYQILGGVRAGIAFQVPIMLGQGNADLKDMSFIITMILCKSPDTQPVKANI